MRMLLTLAFLAALAPAHAQQSGGQSGGQAQSGGGSRPAGGSPPADVPNVATEIVVEDLAISVKRLRVGVTLTPEQVEGLTDALRTSGGSVSVRPTGGEGQGSDDAPAQNGSGGAAEDASQGNDADDG